MLSAEDNPGIFYFLVGMVVIVMTAVGLSLMVDKKSKSSSGIMEIRREISSQAEEISDLTAKFESMSAILAEEQAKRAPQASGRQQTAAVTAVTAQKKAELQVQKSQMEQEIPALDKAFADYRAKYRRRTWDKAVGQEVGNLTVRDGRQYRQVTITKVTDVGLEIRHEHGFARVQAPDLDQSWQDRFQWNDEERRAKLKEESDNLAATPDVTAANEDASVEPEVDRRSSRGNDGGSPDEEALRRLRTLYSGWRDKVNRLKAEQAEAASHSGYGSSQSVPGSLETWKAKDARLRKELSRARVECSQAKAKLAAAAPDDPLLRLKDDRDL